MATGTIRVNTENIFPIIKKFLYSDHEIFLRELVSNGVDACQKIKTLSSLGEFKGETGRLFVEVKLDKEAKTITISDAGIGMTAEEVEKYINQVAFSGAEEFVNQYKDKAQGIIGHFGLGFYSSFMVSKKVEIVSQSWKEGAKAVRWECDGTTDYTLAETERPAGRGTDIILHIAEDSEEFLDEFRIKDILKKYCSFLPVEIIFGTRKEKTGVQDTEGKDIETDVPDVLNDTHPIWMKAPNTLNEDDYKDFYAKLYPYAEQPLFNIHLNVDYPFNLTGVLYFPKLNREKFEFQKNKIQLYSNQVFVTENVEGIVPDFLTMLHGVLDSPDIPLNVSRSYLQSDANVKKISAHISKKVADKLEEMFKNNREDFEQKWDDIKVFIEFGFITDEKFAERAQKFFLLKNMEGKYFTTEEYTNKIKPLQTDKDDRIVYLYASNRDEQYGFIKTATDQGYDVLLMEGPLASHMLNKLEAKMEKASFARVDADVIHKLIKKTNENISKLTKEQEDQLRPLFENVSEKDKFTVQFEPLDSSDKPILITQTEFMRRMKEQEAVTGQSMWGNLPMMYNLVINANHPAISKLTTETDSAKKEKIVNQLTDLALLSNGMLKGEKLDNFISRSVEIIEN
ncbi:MAG TPA: molecular chaperone HtpG [Flavobacteriales bacterium]|nr:molecular chaperone HtpG [Flavobacteriales bacterium]